MDDIATIIKRVIYTINQVDVRGKDNMDKLLGCIQTMERLLEQLSARKEGNP